MKIALHNQQFYFSLFYIISFAVTFFLMVVFSLRRKIPLRSVLLMLTTTSLMTIIGSRLITIPFNEWGEILDSRNTVDYGGRSAIGGLLFGLAGLLFAQKYLVQGKPVMDLYAWIAPIGFGIQKIGCFLNGCCYGKPSLIPWGVQYPAGTNTHYHQWATGLIDANAPFSLSVRPVQLYEVIILFTIAILVLRSKHIWKKRGSTLFFSASIYLFCRFFIEFLRDPSSSAFSHDSFCGITWFQWGLLISGLLCGIILIISEKYLKTGILNKSYSELTVNKAITYFLIISFLLYLIRGILTSFELCSLIIIYIPALFLTSIPVIKSIAGLRTRIATASFLALPLLFVIPTVLPDTIRKPRPIKDFYEKGEPTYNKIDVSALFGGLYNELNYNPHQGTCGTVYTTENYKHEFFIGGGGFSRITKKENTMTTAGINLFGGMNKDINLTNDWEKSYFIFGVDPYIKYDLKWVGIGLGFNIGNLRWIPQKAFDQSSFPEGTRFSPAMPEVSLRLGRPDMLDFRYSYGFNSPATFPLLINEFSIGTGLGSSSDYSLRLGATISGINEPLGFFSFDGLVSTHIGISMKYYFGSTYLFDPNNPSESDHRSNNHFMFGMNYRFGFEK